VYKKYMLLVKYMQKIYASNPEINYDLIQTAISLLAWNNHTQITSSQFH